MSSPNPSKHNKTNTTNHNHESKSKYHNRTRIKDNNNFKHKKLTMPHWPGYGNTLPRMQTHDYTTPRTAPYRVPYGVNPGSAQSGLPSSFGGLYLARGGTGMPQPNQYASELQNFRNMGAWNRMQGGGWRGW
ncbi:hypothetical protein AC578_7164 [Pseudocercospora eumusae]|uniref:Uncharacterized protein n=1 Tax=Pseudocercospora eumusae TaxID=321146 RepID=A0A139HWG1_9PEZI|nr:hypothetical protein AC578_7164 [Pseudocercospora eumusae]